MNNDHLNNISGAKFNSVWDRVSGVNNAAAAAPAATVTNEIFPQRLAELLRDIMDGLSESYHHYCCLARRCRGRISEEFRELARCCRDSIRNLKVQYFIMTGLSYSPRSFIDPSKNTSDMLRTIIARESEDSRLLDKLANETDSPSLARVCLCESRECLRRACEVERLLARCMC